MIPLRVKIIPPPEGIDPMHTVAWFTKEEFIGEVFNVVRIVKQDRPYYMLLKTKNNHSILDKYSHSLSNRARHKLAAEGIRSLHILPACCEILGGNNETFKYLLQGGA